MSHYVVGVVTEEKPSYEYLEDILEPYNENRVVEHTISKQELIDKERESIRSFENGLYKEYLKDPQKYIEENGQNKTHIEYITKIFPKRLNWTDEECYEEAIKIYDEEDILPNGDVVSRYNPNSKWDWWTIGGRWGGLITNKDGEQVDDCLISDMRNLYDEDVAKKSRRFWELYVEGQEPQNSDEEDELKHAFYKKEYYTGYYQTKENYAQCQATFSLYAYIDVDGEWHAKGEMGWFGFSDQAKNAEMLWVNEFSKMLKEAGEKGYWLTIIDCHI